MTGFEIFDRAGAEVEKWRREHKERAAQYPSPMGESYRFDGDGDDDDEGAGLDF